MVLFLSGCKKDDPISDMDDDRIRFGIPEQVTIIGYVSDIMEPFLSRDGQTLFFNNSNEPSVNTNLYYAEKLDDNTFVYRGEVFGVNTESLEGVPTMDSNGNFYFVSTRSYDQSLSTIYCGKFTNGNLSDVNLTSGLSQNQAGWVNFDVEISLDGNTLYAVDGRFDENGGPYESDLFLATKRNGEFVRYDNTDIFQHINTKDLEYAACISANELEFYFTRVAAPISSTSEPKLYVSTRSSITEPFGEPYPISAADGFVEAATISPDSKTLYFHKKVADRFELFKIVKR